MLLYIMQGKHNAKEEKGTNERLAMLHAVGLDHVHTTSELYVNYQSLFVPDGGLSRVLLVHTQGQLQSSHLHQLSRVLVNQIQQDRCENAP